MFLDFNNPCPLLTLYQELYEALWDELYLRSKANGFRIRSIWIADAAHQNQSSVLNEEKLGNDRELSLYILNSS